VLRRAYGAHRAGRHDPWVIGRRSLAVRLAAVLMRALGEPRRAIEFYEQDLTIATEIGDRHDEGNA